MDRKQSWSKSDESLGSRETISNKDERVRLTSCQGRHEETEGL